jgi:intracellular multiplication protein IcmL
VTLLAVPALALAVTVLAVLLARGQGRLYFAVTPDLRVMEMAPVSEPFVSPQALLNWAGETVTRAMSLDFLHWRRKLGDVRPDFDPEGFASFVNALTEGGHISKIVSERLNLSAVMEGAPVIVSQGVERGRMTWRIEMPVVVSYQTSSGVAATQRLLAEVTAQRVPPSQNPRGVVIRQVILSRAG